MDRRIPVIPLSIGLLWIVHAGAAGAVTYAIDGALTSCTGTCNSFPSLAVGSTIQGTVDIATPLGENITDADVADFSLTVLNPAAPPSGPIGDPSVDNPMEILAAAGDAVPNGTTGSMGATHPREIDGQLVLELLDPVWSASGAFLIIDLLDPIGQVQICLFYETAGCIPGATQAAVFDVGVVTYWHDVFVTPGAVDLGPVPVGQEARAQLTVDVEDCVCFTPPLEFGIATGLDPPFSIVADTCSSQVISTGSCSIVLAYQPAGPGVAADTLLLPTQVGDLTIEVSGGGAAASLNVDFGAGRGTPSVRYEAAAGQAGVWNTLGSGESGLVDLSGRPRLALATVNAQQEGSIVFGSGDSATLMADDVRSCAAPTSTKWDVSFDGIVNGTYDVYVYAPASSTTSTGPIDVDGIALPSTPREHRLPADRGRLLEQRSTRRHGRPDRDRRRQRTHGL